MQVIGPDDKAYAIKFVNLAGQKAHVIECFRREIEVLTDMQGETRIVQLIDSEVSLPLQWSHALDEQQAAADAPPCRHACCYQHCYGRAAGLRSGAGVGAGTG